MLDPDLQTCPHGDLVSYELGDVRLRTLVDASAGEGVVDRGRCCFYPSEKVFTLGLGRLTVHLLHSSPPVLLDQASFHRGPPFGCR
jgi:hypothetical protein